MNRPGQRLGQLRDLGAQAPLGQIGQHGRVMLAIDQRLQHQPARHAGDVAGHRGQLDPGILQQLLQPLDLPAAFSSHRRAGPGQVPQLADWGGRHEGAVDQAVRTQLGQPRGVGDVAFAAGQVLHLSSVDQHHLKVGVLEQVVERLPVIPGGLHHHQTDLFIDQVFPKRQHRICGRAPGAHRLHGFAAPPPGNPDTDLRVPFRHIHPRTAAVDDFHDRLPPVVIEAVDSFDARRAKANFEV